MVEGFVWVMRGGGYSGDGKEAFSVQPVSVQLKQEKERRTDGEAA
jgi:hypothetical protein